MWASAAGLAIFPDDRSVTAVFRYNQRDVDTVLQEDSIVSMIFPGMDPYLEDPQLWEGFHQGFIIYIRNYLQPLLRPRYIAAVEERVYLEGADREISRDLWVRRARAESAPRPPSPTQSSVAVLEEETPL